MKASLVILTAFCFRSLLLAQAFPLTTMPAVNCAKAKYTVRVPVSKAYNLALGVAAESMLKITESNPARYEFTYREPVLQEAGDAVLSRRVTLQLTAMGPSCTRVSAKRFGPRLPENLSKEWQNIIASATPSGSQ